MKDTKEAKIFLDAFSGARKAFQSFVALGKPTEDFASKRDHILMGFINRKITFDTPSSANDSQTTQSKDNNTKARNRKTGDKKTSPTNKATVTYANGALPRRDYIRPTSAGEDCIVETIQDCLIKLDIKPLMHLLEISIFFTK